MSWLSLLACWLRKLTGWPQKLACWRADFLDGGSKLSAAYLANAADLPGLENLHRDFAALLTELRDLGVRQDAQTAAVQQTSKDLAPVCRTFAPKSQPLG